MKRPRGGWPRKQVTDETSPWRMKRPRGAVPVAGVPVAGAWRPWWILLVLVLVLVEHEFETG